MDFQSFPSKYNFHEVYCEVELRETIRFDRIFFAKDGTDYLAIIDRSLLHQVLYNFDFEEDEHEEAETDLPKLEDKHDWIFVFRFSTESERQTWVEIELEPDRKFYAEIKKLIENFPTSQKE
ncbi:MAG: hypothetical protein SF029_13935 [bacterium]|nr:hypothetical protein [bacterium]